MDEKRALNHYLDPQPPRVSSFRAARNDAREATGRDEQGDVVHESRSGNWLGANVRSAHAAPGKDNRASTD